LAKHSHKPFGTGERACIGRQFALHEAVLVLARILHRYDLAGDTSYALAVTERLTLIPHGSSPACGRGSRHPSRRSDPHRPILGMHPGATGA
jgi:cytochrome P450